MRKRLATEYVKTSFTVTRAEMSEFIRFFEEHQVSVKTKVLDKGNQEFMFHDNESGDEFVLNIVSRSQLYVVTGCCRLTRPMFVNAMRKAVSDFKGDALVNRIYKGFTMVYEYKHGSVVKIEEVQGSHRKKIFEYKDSLSIMEHMFKKVDIEKQINEIRQEVDWLLDIRNMTTDRKNHEEIDRRLMNFVRQLFELEG